MSSDLPPGWKIAKIEDVLPDAAIRRLGEILLTAGGPDLDETLRTFKAEVIDAHAAEIRSRGNDPQFVYYAIAHALGWL